MARRDDILKKIEAIRRQVETKPSSPEPDLMSKIQAIRAKVEGKKEEKSKWTEAWSEAENIVKHMPIIGAPLRIKEAAEKALPEFRYEEGEKPSLAKEMGRSVIATAVRSSRQMFPGIQKTVTGKSFEEWVAEHFSPEDYKEMMSLPFGGKWAAATRLAQSTPGLVASLETLGALGGGIGFLGKAGEGASTAAKLAETAKLGALWGGTEGLSQSLEKKASPKETITNVISDALFSAAMFPAIEGTFMGLTAGGKKGVQKFVSRRIRKKAARILEELKKLADKGDPAAVEDAALAAGVSKKKAKTLAMRIAKHSLEDRKAVGSELINRLNKIRMYAATRGVEGLPENLARLPESGEAVVARVVGEETRAAEKARAKELAKQIAEQRRATGAEVVARREKARLLKDAWKTAVKDIESRREITKKTAQSMLEGKTEKPVPIYDAAKQFIETTGKVDFNLVRKNYPAWYQGLRKTGIIGRGKVTPEELYEYLRDSGYDVRSPEEALMILQEDYKAAKAGHIKSNRFFQTKALEPDVYEYLQSSASKRIIPEKITEEYLNVKDLLETAEILKKPDKVISKVAEKRPSVIDELKRVDPATPAQAKLVAAAKRVNLYEPIENPQKIGLTNTELGRHFMSEYQYRLREVGFQSKQWLKKKYKEYTPEQIKDMFWAYEGEGDPFRGLTKEQLEKRLTPKMKEEIKKLKALHDEFYERIANSPWIETPEYHVNYLTHRYNMSEGEAKKIVDRLFPGKEGLKRNPYKAQRVFRTYAEAARAKGYKPLYEDPFRLAYWYANNTARIEAYNKLITDLGKYADPMGRPLRITSEMRKSRRFSDYVKIEGTTGKNFYVHPEIAKMLDVINNKTFDNAFFQQIKKVNLFMKMLHFAYSTFHHFVLTQSRAASGGIRNALKDAVEAFNLALKNADIKELLDEDWRKIMFKSPLELKAPTEVGAEMIQNLQETYTKRFERWLGTKAGRGLAKVVNIPAGIPVKLGKFNTKYLWNYLHEIFKIRTFQENFLKAKEALPDIPDEVIADHVGNYVNNLYGGQNWQRLGIGQKIKDLLQLLIEAPDWNLSMIRQFSMLFKGLFKEESRVGKALKLADISVLNTPQDKQMAKFIRGRSRKYWFNILWQTYLAENIVNYIFTGMKGDPHFLWQNEPGRRLEIELWYNGEDGRKRYIGGLFKQAYDAIRWYTHPLRTVKQKLAPFARNIYEQMTGETTSGWTLPFKGKEGVTSVPSRAYQVLKNMTPYSFSGSGVPMSPFHIKKGMSRYQAVKMMREALEKGDYDKLDAIMKAAWENGVNAQDALKAAYRTVKSRRTRQLKKETGVK